MPRLLCFSFINSLETQLSRVWFLSASWISLKPRAESAGIPSERPRKLRKTLQQQKCFPVGYTPPLSLLIQVISAAPSSYTTEVSQQPRAGSHAPFHCCIRLIPSYDFKRAASGVRSESLFPDYRLSLKLRDQALTLSLQNTEFSLEAQPWSWFLLPL